MGTPRNKREMAALIKRARAEGAKAAKEKLAELQAQGNQYVVQQHANPLDDNSPVVKQWGMLDLCGMASLRIQADGRSRIIRLLQEVAQDDSARIYLYKDYYIRKCWNLSIYDMSTRQEVSVNEAAVRAVQDVFRAAGIDCYVSSRLD